MKIIGLYVLVFLSVSSLNATRYEFHSCDPRSKTDVKVRQKRMVWTNDLERLFVSAFNELGNNATPKLILNKMNDLAKAQADENIIKIVGKLTREQVSSHLQKVRKKKQKEDERLEKLDKNGEINRMGKINAILN